MCRQGASGRAIRSLQYGAAAVAAAYMWKGAPHAWQWFCHIALKGVKDCIAASVGLWLATNALSSHLHILQPQAKR